MTVALITLRIWRMKRGATCVLHQVPAVGNFGSVWKSLGNVFAIAASHHRTVALAKSPYHIKKATVMLAGRRLSTCCST
jgi:hypothetical protein